VEWLSGSKRSRRAPGGSNEIPDDSSANEPYRNQPRSLLLSLSLNKLPGAPSVPPSSFFTYSVLTPDARTAEGVPASSANTVASLTLKSCLAAARVQSASFHKSLRTGTRVLAVLHVPRVSRFVKGATAVWTRNERRIHDRGWRRSTSSGGLWNSLISLPALALSRTTTATATDASLRLLFLVLTRRSHGLA